MNHLPFKYRVRQANAPSYTLTRFLIETALCALVGLLLVALFLPCL
jgi:hypothetical protein